MKKFMMLATAGFVMTVAAPAFAEDAATTTTTTTTTEAPTEVGKDAPADKMDGKPHKGGRGIFERGDTNGDGVVTKEEFLAQSEEGFKALDTNGDGKITKAEVEEKRKKMREMYAQRKKQMGDKPVPGKDAPAAAPAEEKSE